MTARFAVSEMKSVYSFLKPCFQPIVTLSKPDKFVIDTRKEFPLLARAPITEAILQIRGRSPMPWDEARCLESLKADLPDYPVCESQRMFQQDMALIPGAAASPVVDLGWAGARFLNTAKTQVANFERDAFAFSRLAPYESWDKFRDEALRLFLVHQKHAHLEIAQRIGLRFVNQFDAPEGEFQLDDFFSQPLPAPHPSLPFPRAQFFHQDTFAVPGHSYLVTVIRTMQPAAATPLGPIPAKLILDIDVFTLVPPSLEIPQLHTRLSEMRWLKNELFFGSLTAFAINTFR